MYSKKKSDNNKWEINTTPFGREKTNFPCRGRDFGVIS